jgi:hypothetical protein
MRAQSAARVSGAQPPLRAAHSVHWATRFRVRGCFLRVPACVENLPRCFLAAATINARGVESLEQRVHYRATVDRSCTSAHLVVGLNEKLHKKLRLILKHRTLFGAMRAPSARPPCLWALQTRRTLPQTLYKELTGTPSAIPRTGVADKYKYNTNTKYTCDTGQTRNKLLAQWDTCQTHYGTSKGLPTPNA